MSPRQRWAFRTMVAVWLLTVAGFWVWWARPDHIVGTAGFVLTTSVLAYQFLMPAFFLFFIRRAARPHPALEVPPGLRVAFATTFVPGAESIEVLERTVTAMRDQRGYTHDVWVLDEGDDPTVKKLCTSLGIYHFSRKGRNAYQSQEWPFKARTKAGNYNSWLHWARRHHHRYDVLIQMDTDHVPQPGYMVEMLRPFADPGVAYVAAPSITSGNAAESWSARARCELEATLHGALQMGYNDGWAPLIIGSHAAFRLSALASIGGFQHTLAEDHHNTLRLNATGHRGVFNPDAIAIGDGAASFAEAMLQEYQWARALTQILLNFLPRDIRRLPSHLALQFVFAETWYPLFALTQAIAYLTPVIAIATGQALVSVDYWTFLAMFTPSVVVCLLIVVWTRRQGWLRPADAAILSWRSILLTLARWPFVAMAVGEAVLGRTLRRDFAFRVTVKGVAGARALPLRVLLPYLLIIAATLAALIYHLAHPNPALDGYARLALLNAALYVVLVVSVVLLNARENRRVQRIRRRAVLRMHLGGYAAGLAGAACILLIALPSLRIPSPVPPPAQAVAADAPIVAAPRGGGPSLALPQGQEFLGVYDPVGDSDGLHADAQEIFVDWSPTVGSELTADLAQIVSRQRVPFVTVQPYPWNIDGLTAATLLPDISSGRYDGTIRSIAAAVAAVAPDPVYVRFAQEMDLGGDYPWAGSDPSAYIAAYRHFTTLLRASGATNAQMVWSPTGNLGSTAYYPGPDYVDMVGTTLLVASVWDASEGYSSPPSFEQMLQQRYGVLAALEKPIVVAEMAVSLQPQSGATAWLAAARQSLTQYPLVRGLIYFDAPEPPMPHLTVRPDWMLSPAQLQQFLTPLAAPESPLPTPRQVVTPTPHASPSTSGVQPGGRRIPGWLRGLGGSVARAAAGVAGRLRGLPAHIHAFSLSLDPDPVLRAPLPAPDRSGGIALHPSTAGSHSLAAPTARRSQ